MASKLFQTDIDLGNVSKIVQAPNAVSDTDVPNFGQVKALVEGNSWKDGVRAASTANINLASPGAAIDGVTMAANDRFLAKDQTTASQNGIYVWNGAAVAATRALDGSTFAELEAAVTIVEEGTTNVGTKWRQTQVNGTIDVSNVVWVADSSSAPPASETTAGIAEIATQAETDTGTDDSRFLTPLKGKNASWMVKKFSQTIGDGSALSYVVTHNLNNQRCMVDVTLTGSTFDEVECEVEHTSANSVTIKVNTAPAAGAYTVSCVG